VLDLGGGAALRGEDRSVQSGAVVMFFDSDAFYVALDRKRRIGHMKWRDVAREAGISASTLTQLNAQSARSFVACYRTYQEYILNTREQAKAGFQV
jgi:hypothetical protein